jgi:hypothetical protein
MTSLTDLIERVEGATGPDREADCELWALHHGLTLEWQGTTLVAGEEGVVGWIDPGRLARNFYTNRARTGPGSIPAYTASLDAALTLCERVLPGWNCNASLYRDTGQYGPAPPARAYVWFRGREYEAEAPTPPQAQVRAKLKAHPAKDPTP